MCCGQQQEGQQGTEEGGGLEPHGSLLYSSRNEKWVATSGASCALNSRSASCSFRRRCRLPPACEAIT